MKKVNLFFRSLLAVGVFLFGMLGTQGVMAQSTSSEVAGGASSLVTTKDSPYNLTNYTFISGTAAIDKLQTQAQALQNAANTDDDAAQNLNMMQAIYYRTIQMDIMNGSSVSQALENTYPKLVELYGQVPETFIINSNLTTQGIYLSAINLVKS
jgi:hypothetical protein